MYDVATVRGYEMRKEGQGGCEPLGSRAKGVRVGQDCELWGV